MSDPHTRQPAGFEIHVSSDQTVVTVDVQAKAEVSAATIIAGLQEMKLAGFDDGAVIAALEQRKGQAISIPVATGTAPVNERPERIEYYVPVAQALHAPSPKSRRDKSSARSPLPSPAPRAGMYLAIRSLLTKVNEHLRSDEI